jgi:hypothetical protein
MNTTGTGTGKNTVIPVARWALPPVRRMRSIHNNTVLLLTRYKEERRRQLAAHVASRLSSNPSSSEEDEEQADRRSYTEFRYLYIFICQLLHYFQLLQALELSIANVELFCRCCGAGAA